MESVSFDLRARTFDEHGISFGPVKATSKTKAKYQKDRRSQVLQRYRTTRTTEYVRGCKLKRSGVSWIIDRSGRSMLVRVRSRELDANVRRGHFRDASQTETTVVSAFEMQGSFSKTIFFLHSFGRQRKESFSWKDKFIVQTNRNFVLLFLLFFYEKKDKCFRNLLFLFYRQKGNYLFGSMSLLFKREKFLLSFFFRQESVYLEPPFLYGKGVIFLRGGMLSLTSECLCYLASKIAVF